MIKSIEKKFFCFFVLVVLSLPGTLCAAFSFFDPGNEAAYPATLSASGLYTGKVITSEAVNYTINVPHWKDGLSALSYIIKKPEAQIIFDNTDDSYIYTNGVAFIQTLYIDTIIGSPASRILWETRLLMKKDSVWLTFNYKWRVDQTDADFINELEGVDTLFSVWDGNKRQQHKWRFDDRLGCDICHQGRMVQGFFTAQLNRSSIDNPAINQITSLFSANVLSGNQPTDFVSLPKWAPHTDATASLETRVRSYLAANCSACHGEKGVVEGPEINLDFHTMSPVDSPALVSQTSAVIIPDCYDEIQVVYAGKPNHSTLYYRQTQRAEITLYPEDYYANVDQMPPTSTFLADSAGLLMIHEWICQMDPAACAAQGCADPDIIYPDNLPVSDIPVLETGSFRVKNRIVTLSGSLLSKHKTLNISMTNLNGQVNDVKVIGNGVFQIHQQTPPGLYIFNVNNQSFLRMVF
ncbi:MAG: hypothetical protein HQK83_13535 [Fibrobacteria bacterium]|nr:hypothetical protein [Fibrobacteria bacterium]